MLQYIDFFNENRERIERSCAGLLNGEREKALEIFSRVGFPEFRSEDYRHTDIDTLLAPEFGFYFGFSGAEIDPHRVFRCNMPNMNSVLHFTVNGQYYQEQPAHELPEGVFLGGLNEFAKLHPDIFSARYNHLANREEEGLTAFNTLFVQDGFVLYVPENVVLEKPLQLTNICSGEIDALINRRILVILEAGAQAKLLACDHTTNEKTRFAITQVTEIYVGENSLFDFYELEESSPDTIRLASCFVRQEASSNVALHTITLTNGTTRNNCIVDLSGQNAEVHLSGMAIADDREQIDNYTVINHHVPHCRSDELYKYVLDGEALGVFSGRIIVDTDARKTEAYQTNRNLCGSSECRIYSKPQLEIYADDVKCSHGMTTGQLDEQALFYMRSRGIPEEEARYLLKKAFTMDILDRIRMEGLKERLKLLVEKRFRGELIRCQGCI